MVITINSSTQEILRHNKCQMRFLDKLVLEKLQSEIIDKFESQKSQNIRSISNSESNLKKETEQPIKTDRTSNTVSG